MKKWQYKSIQFILHITSLMPFWTLYVIADIIYVVLFYIIKYRREVVEKNLQESFPNKSKKERTQIEHKFYRNLADYFVETIKLNNVSDSAIKKRITFKNIEIIDNLFDQNRSIVAYFSHCGNWEWVTSITRWSRYKHGSDVEFCQVYRPLRDPWYDAYMLKLRGRFNSLSFKKRSVLRDLIMIRRRNIPSITGFMSDQKPSRGDESHIVKFLNHPTAFITGTEQIARKLDMAVVYFDMHKPRRGHYEVEIKVISTDPSSMPNMAITDAYISLLENTINRNPSIWLWSHNRWKNKVKMPNE